MRNKTATDECIAVIGSMTRAMRAQNVLASAAIRAEIVKADAAQGKRGCVYALRYPCAQSGNVSQILSDAGIRWRASQKDFHDLS